MLKGKRRRIKCYLQRMNTGRKEEEKKEGENKEGRKEEKK